MSAIAPTGERVGISVTGIKTVELTEAWFPKWETTNAYWGKGSAPGFLNTNSTALCRTGSEISTVTVFVIVLVTNADAPLEIERTTKTTARTVRIRTLTARLGELDITRISSRP